MKRTRWILLPLAVALSVGVLALWQTRAASRTAGGAQNGQRQQKPIVIVIDKAGSEKPLLAAGNGSTPGQLSIVSKKGAEVGVCPLKHTDVQADIAGYVCRVRVTQE